MMPSKKNIPSSGGGHLGEHAGLLRGRVGHGRGGGGGGGHLLGWGSVGRGSGWGSLTNRHGGSLAGLLGRGRSSATLTSHCELYVISEGGKVGRWGLIGR